MRIIMLRRVCWLVAGVGCFGAGVRKDVKTDECKYNLCFIADFYFVLFSLIVIKLIIFPRIVE